MTSHQDIKKIMILKHQKDVKQPRACDLCLNKHAVWYCASDDAFLCHVCDESVHSANHVATKHERVCLRTNEILNGVLHQGTTSNPVWHSGFRRKARTRRSRCERNTRQKIDDERRREDPRVPEIEGEAMFFIPEANGGDDMASIVPEFEEFTEMGFFLSNHNGTDETTKHFNFEDEMGAMEGRYYNEEEEKEAAKTKGAEACPGQSKTKDYDNVIAISAKVEESEDFVMKDYVNGIAISGKAKESEVYEINAKQRNMLLRLNYEHVIAAWDKLESPREATNNTSNFQLVPPGIEEKKTCNRSEREAKVWKYRDKRKNRLFEKKIRYEVRKVNADKRPRMKGRFVRRSLATGS